MTKAEDMAAIFDMVDVEEDTSAAADYNSVSSDGVPSTSFDQKCDDVEMMMKPEAEHKDIILSAFEEADHEPEPEPELSDESGGQFADEVARDMSEFDIEIESSGTKSVNVSSDLEPVPDPLDVVEDKVFVASTNKNPLGLKGDELQFYNECVLKYPQFSLYDGSVSFREFYKYKVYMLKQILSKFPVLDCEDIHAEISNMNTDHFLGDRVVVTHDVIRYKLDESYKWRARLSAIILKVIPQFYMWERWSELLKSKLWKDHEMKGAHRRDGLTMEHMADVEAYVIDLKGVMESGKHADNILKAASDSLSRQLSCLQLGEAMGTTQEGTQKVQEQAEQAEQAEKMKQVNTLDGFDSIDPGEKISAPVHQKVPSMTFGVEADDLAMLG